MRVRRVVVLTSVPNIVPTTRVSCSQKGTSVSKGCDPLKHVQQGPQMHSAKKTPLKKRKEPFAQFVYLDSPHMPYVFVGGADTLVFFFVPRVV